MHIIKDLDLMKRVALQMGDANFPKKYYSDNLRTLLVVVPVVFAGEVQHTAAVPANIARVPSVGISARSMMCSYRTARPVYQFLLTEDGCEAK